MSIELRILSGARAGQAETFEQPRVAVGRHPSNDLRFDTQADLNVSTRHGDILRGDDGRYVIRDNRSTNGTFVNGARLAFDEERELHDGDVITFGARGPEASVRIGSAAVPAMAPAIAPEPSVAPVVEPIVSPMGSPLIAPSVEPSVEPSVRAAANTTDRVAIAVAHQTRRLRIGLAATVVLIGGLGFAAYWAGHREARAADARLVALMASYDSSSRELQARLQSMNDTALIRRLEQQTDSLKRVVRVAKGNEASAARQTLQRHQAAARAIGAMDLPAVQHANDDAVVLIRTDIGTTGLEATGFAVTARGVIVTNRHVVADGGARASRISVKFANTGDWRPAHLLAMPRDTSIDLALVQLDDAAHVPAVAELGRATEVPVGGAIATLGFPDGSDLPMDGANAKTTLTLGTVSKRTEDLLQIDSYASQGSSGSPVFDGRGHVVGVVFGGAVGSGGRIVFAVPANRIAELVQAAR